LNIVFLRTTGYNKRNVVGSLHEGKLVILCVIPLMKSKRRSPLAKEYGVAL
jgi:hypothetical protein